MAGSRILAWLSGCLLARLGKKGAELLLPQLVPGGKENEVLEKLLGDPCRALEGSGLPVPNRASGTLPLPMEEAQAILEGLYQALEEDWGVLLDEVERKSRQSTKSVWKVVAPAIGRPTCPLQLIWVVCVAPADRRQGLEQVDALYAAAKRSRPIPTHEGGAPVRKCGQCGRREAMGGDDPKQLRTFQSRLSELDEVRRGLRFTADEFLCPICALRRLAGYLDSQPFCSTSAVAASEWLWRLRSAGLEATLDSLEKAAQDVPGFEPAWVDRTPLYYEQSALRLQRQARRERDEPAVRALAKVLGEKKKLATAVEQHGRKPGVELPQKPPEYLAVVMFDGDDMGRQLRTHLEKLPGGLLRFQRRLQELLVRKDTKAAPLGTPFYLGGDEGLLLAPVSRVLDLAEEIRRLWQEELNIEPTNEEDGRPSLSMGITLFDRERPLGTAIESARSALKVAKRMPGKRALAMSVQTASGNVLQAVATWGESWERVREAVAMIRGGELASGWPHDVEVFLRTLQEDAFQAGEATRAAIRTEVQRLTFRRLLAVQEGAGVDDRRAAAWKRLRGESWWKRQPDGPELKSMSDQLHLIAILARQAGTEPKAAGPMTGRNEDVGLRD